MTYAFDHVRQRCWWHFQIPAVSLVCTHPGGYSAAEAFHDARDTYWPELTKFNTSVIKILVRLARKEFLDPINRSWSLHKMQEAVERGMYE